MIIVPAVAKHNLRKGVFSGTIKEICQDIFKLAFAYSNSDKLFDSKVCFQNATCLTQSQLCWWRPVGQAFKLPMSRPGSQCGPIQIQIANVQRPSNVPVEQEQLLAMFPSYLHTLSCHLVTLPILEPVWKKVKSDL